MWGWLAAREPREQWLIVIAAALSVALAAYYGLARPAYDYYERSAQSFDQAQRDLLYVQNSIKEAAALKAAQSGEAQTARGPVRSTVSQSAIQKGLAISRLQPEGDNQTTVWLDRASPQLLHVWIIELERERGVHVIDATITAAEPGAMVPAKLTFAGS